MLLLAKLGGESDIAMKGKEDECQNAKSFRSESEP